MKTNNYIYSTYSQIFTALLIALLALAISPPALSQERNLDREILAYILADSLEIPPEVTGRITLNRAEIASNNLVNALQELAINEIERAFPNWDAADSVRVLDTGRVVQRPRFHRVFIIHLPEQVSRGLAIERLESEPSILFAETHMDAELFNDPEYPDQWHLNNTGQGNGTSGADISAEQAWQIFTGSSDINIAIFDTGIELTHDDFTGKVSGDNIDGTGAEFAWSHGTHVAGIAAAHANNEHAGRGVDWNAQLVSKQIFDGFGQYFGDNTVATAIIEAVDNDNAHVLNHSWGGTGFKTTVAKAFAYAHQMNRVSAAAMGNDFENGNPIKYPAAYGQSVIAVGGTDNTDERSPFSQTGNHINVVAPGGVNRGPGVGEPFDENDILSTARNNGTVFLSGTSMATPQISGIASLLKGYDQSLYNDDIRRIIELSADEVDGMQGQNWTVEYGHGRVNAHQALLRLQSPYVLEHNTASGGSVFSSTDPFTKVFFGVPGLADGSYIVKRYDVRKDVNFSWLDEAHVWGRGVAATGFSAANPNFGLGFTDAVSVNNSSATLRTFVYEVWTISGVKVGWVPTKPQNVEYAYTVHGIPGTAPPPPPPPPLAVEIDGPTQMQPFQFENFFAIVSGGSSPYNFQWQAQTGSQPWQAVGQNSDSYAHLAQSEDFNLQVTVTDVNNETANAFHSVSVDDGGPFMTEMPDLPDEFALKNNYPNPFNPSTTIRYDLPERADVRLEVFDMLGRRVAVLVSGQVQAGRHSTVFDA
ncbi:MAG: S8 family serine peptidase, partial [Bacteroidales bacterium]